MCYVFPFWPLIFCCDDVMLVSFHVFPWISPLPLLHTLTIRILFVCLLHYSLHVIHTVCFCFGWLFFFCFFVLPCFTSPCRFSSFDRLLLWCMSIFLTFLYVSLFHILATSFLSPMVSLILRILTDVFLSSLPPSSDLIVCWVPDIC